MDIESAYHLIPVHVQDCPYQKIKWDGMLYIDSMFPFWFCSVPKVYNAIDDIHHWYLQQRWIPYIWHYLDDFIVAGPTELPECQLSMAILVQVCSDLEVPTAEHKTCLGHFQITQ